MSAAKQGILEAKPNHLLVATIAIMVNFFDTLGIGGFAPLVVLLKRFKLVQDKLLPGTLNTALCLPSIIEALIYIKNVPIDAMTLLSMITAAIIGSLLGVRLVARLNVGKVQLVMALALSLVLMIMLSDKAGFISAGGSALGLTGTKLAIAITGNFILGVLMSFGIGPYAPCMALVYSLGLSPIAAFPIMMGSCGLVMPIASIKFIKLHAYHRRVSLLIGTTGLIGVVAAVAIIHLLSSALLTWAAIIIISYTVWQLFASAHRYLSAQSA